MASFFNRNTGKVDRIIRVVVGVLLVGNVFIRKKGGGEI